MKICFIGNPQTVHLHRWMKYFIDKGHEVHMITPEPAEIEGAHIHEISLAAFYDAPTLFFYKIRIIGYILNLFRRYRLIRQTKKIIEKIKPDILDAHYLTYYGVFASHLDFHPFVITVWGSDILIDIKKYGKGRASLMKEALEKADMITTDAEHVKENIIKLSKRNHGDIKIIQFGVDVQKFDLQQMNTEFRQKLGISNSPVIISLRNLYPLYAVESLIRAISIILKKVPEAKFIIAGDGDQKGYLKNLALSLGVLDRIKFVGWITNDELPQYLASADVYVSTSLSDAGIASSTAEAMACGLPVVITDFGDNRKWVEDGVNGFIVPLKSPASLAEKIIYLLKNKDIGVKMGGINRKIIEERNNYYTEMKKMENNYMELVKRYKQ